MRIVLACIMLLSIGPYLHSQSQEPAGSVNPLLVRWTTPFGVPPFAEIRDDDFLPAFTEAIARERAEIDAITASSEPPTFAKTIAALDAAGELLDRVEGVFGNLSSAETNERRQAIAKQVAPLTAALQDDILLNPKLFARVRTVWEAREASGLDPEQRKLVEETYKSFVRGGAQLSPEKQARLRAINEEMSTLGLRFSDNLLKETNAYRLVVSSRDQLRGLPEGAVAAAADAAAAAGQEGEWVFTLHAPSIWPFLSYAEDRELRKQLLTAYADRGQQGNGQDNRTLLLRIVALRAERAQLLGYPTHADFVLAERMAKTPANVYGLLNQLWSPALAAAHREAADLQAMMQQEGLNDTLRAWDWRYYAEKVKKARFDLDETEASNYFSLDRVRDGAFAVANRLYGITFTERTDIPKYHPEVRTFEVKDADGTHLGVFITDYHPRPGKRGGAWTSRFRGQYVRDGVDVRPIVVNVCNFTRPAGDAPALLRTEEVETLFHEFGHALHSLLSRIHYQGVAGVPRDFVELPSQIMEHWAFEPEVLAMYARHWKTGAPIPPVLVEKINKAGTFNQGFMTVEYLAASFLDMDWHTVAAANGLDANAFEQTALTRIHLMPEIIVRYRSPYFQHIFAGGYSAGYYSYIWSEVLDSDAFEAFREHGIFDPATASSFRKNILEKGGTEEAMAMYKKFRGREPSVEPLLRKRGLDKS